MFVNEKFDSTRTDIVHRFSCSYRLFTHIFPQFGSDENRRSLFHDFLVTALHGTFAFAQMNDISMLVTKNLELDVMRLFNELLQINRVVAKGRQRFALGSGISFFHFFDTVDEAHTLSTTAHRSFQHHRVSDLIAKFYGFFHTFQIVLCAGNNGYSRLDHFDTGSNFIPHGFHCFRIRSDKDDSFFLTSTGEGSILGQEAVTRMDGVRMGCFRHFDDFFYIQITLFGCCRPYAISFVCIKHMLRGPICFGEDSDTRYLHLPAGAHHPYGNFTAIGY